MVRLVPVEKASASGRPAVGQLTSGPVVYSEGVFDPLSDQDLEVWGL